jgi:hypothetical protein
MEMVGWGIAIGLIGFGLCLVAVAGRIEDAVRYYVDNVRKRDAQ